MKKIVVDIAKTIESKNLHALNEMGYKSVKNLEQYCTGFKEPTLLVLDFNGVIAVNYRFVKIAFDQLFNVYPKDGNMFIIMSIKGFELEQITKGISDLLKLEKGVDDDYQALVKTHFPVAVFNKENGMKYLADLSENHTKVLEGLQQKDMNSLSIMNAFDFNIETTSLLIEDLKDMKFIFSSEHDGEGNPIYKSLKPVL